MMAPRQRDWERIVARLEEMERANARLQDDNTRLAATVAALAREPRRQPEAGRQGEEMRERTSRRGLLRTALGATVAVLGADAALGTPLDTARASTGGGATLGARNSAETATQILYDGSSAPGAVLLVNTDAHGDLAGARFPASLAGWADAVSAAPATTGVYGFTCVNTGFGVVGWSNAVGGTGVYGLCQDAQYNPQGIGVSGLGLTGVQGASNSADGAGVLGLNGNGTAIKGDARNAGMGAGTGVLAQSDTGVGVQGLSTGGYGVQGASVNEAGVYGVSESGAGVSGVSAGIAGVYGHTSNPFGNAVYGDATTTGGTGSAIGVLGRGDAGNGVQGLSTSGNGVLGQSTTGSGVAAYSSGGAGLVAQGGSGQPSIHAVAAGLSLSASPGASAIFAEGGDGNGVYATSAGAQAAAYATCAGSGDGVAGYSAGGNGLHGHSTSGNGVYASSLGAGTGLKAVSNSGYGAELSGGLAPLRLDPSGTAGPPSGGSHHMGELYVDKNGVLYYCVTSGAPGAWKSVTLT